MLAQPVNIKTPEDYKQAMVRIDVLMNKGSANLNSDETDELQKLSDECQRFEVAHFIPLSLLKL